MTDPMSGPDAATGQLLSRFQVYESWDGQKWFVLDTVADEFVSGVMSKSAASVRAATLNRAIDQALAGFGGAEAEGDGNG